MLRSTRLLFATQRTCVARPIVNARFISVTHSLQQESSGQGMGEKKDVGGSNPVSARGEGVKNFAKSVAEGAQGIAQKVTGNHEGNPNAKDGGFSGGKYQNEEEVEKGMKTGVDKKGDEQSSI